jgi:hypothetical protein
MVDSVDLVDDVDAEKIHLRDHVHSVHDVHSVHCLDKSIRLQLPSLRSQEGSFRPPGLPVFHGL